MTAAFPMMVPMAENPHTTTAIQNMSPGMPAATDIPAHVPANPNRIQGTFFRGDRAASTAPPTIMPTPATLSIKATSGAPPPKCSLTNSGTRVNSGIMTSTVPVINPYKLRSGKSCQTAPIPCRNCTQIPFRRASCVSCCGMVHSRRGTIPRMAVSTSIPSAQPIGMALMAKAPSGAAPIVMTPCMD